MSYADEKSVAIVWGITLYTFCVAIGYVYVPDAKHQGVALGYIPFCAYTVFGGTVPIGA